MLTKKLLWIGTPFLKSTKCSSSTATLIHSDQGLRNLCMLDNFSTWLKHQNTALRKINWSTTLFFAALTSFQWQHCHSNCLMVLKILCLSSRPKLAEQAMVSQQLQFSLDWPEMHMRATGMKSPTSQSSLTHSCTSSILTTCWNHQLETSKFILISIIFKVQ